MTSAVTTSFVAILYLCMPCQQNNLDHHNELWNILFSACGSVHITKEKPLSPSSLSRSVEKKLECTKKTKKKKKKENQEKRKLAVILKTHVFKASTPLLCSVIQKTGCRADADLTRKETKIMFYRCAWQGIRET